MVIQLVIVIVIQTVIVIAVAMATLIVVIVTEKITIRILYTNYPNFGIALLSKYLFFYSGVDVIPAGLRKPIQDRTDFISHNVSTTSLFYLFGGCSQ